MASLTLQGITKRFGGLTALDRVDVAVEDGKICVLLGPSGCGKSTLLNIIAGLIPQDEGTVLFDGQSVDHLSPGERDVAMVFQSYALYPHMSVEENLGFGLRMRRLPKEEIRSRILEAARILGIEDLLGRRPRELSGGQRQRVAMGRALVRRPRIFLLDEPLSNLDARLRANVRLELKGLHRQIRRTMIYVTHDQVEAMTLGDRIAVMRQGRIHQVGPPDEIYARPADPFVATFIGAPEMNLYRGRVSCEDGRVLFRGAGFSLVLQGLDAGTREAQVELGIRPEDLTLGDMGPLVLQARVDMVSDVGSEKYIHARIGEEPLTARISKDLSPEPNSLVTLSLDPKRLHLFCGGKRI